MSQRIRWMLVGALAAVVFGGGAAFATTQLLEDGTTINACAQKETGQLRLSKDGSCGPAENAVSWNQQGPAGPPGPPGGAGITSIDDLVGTPCTLAGRHGALYFIGGNGTTDFQRFPQCVMPDGSEPNETRETAAPYSSMFRTIDPAGDEDWFSIPNKAISSVSVYQQDGISPAETPFTAELYRDGILFKTATRSASGYWTLSYYQYVDAPGDTAPHDWLVHVTSPGLQLYMMQGGY